MPIMEEMKKNLAVAITAAGITAANPAFTQDANASEDIESDKNIVQMVSDNSNGGEYVKVAQEGELDKDDLLKSEIRYRKAKIDGKVVEITPEVVKEFAAKGRVKIPSAREDKPMSWQAFLSSISKWRSKKMAGIIIGVVVDDKPYTPLDPDYTGRDHFRDVYKKVVELMTGRKADGSKVIQGLAELYGGEVLNIVPITFNKGDYYRSRAFGTTYLRVDDIIVAYNDNIFYSLHKQKSGEYRFFNDMDRLEVYLRHIMKTNRHKYLSKEIRNRTRREAILKAAREENGPDNNFPMFTKEYDNFVARNWRYYEGKRSSSAGGSSKGGRESAPDVSSVLSHD